MEPTDYAAFIAHSSAKVVAEQLLSDLDLCSQNPMRQLPTLLALHMPPFSSPEARQISKYLVSSPNVDIEIRELIYESKLQRIKQALKREPLLESYPDGHTLTCDLDDDRGREILFEAPHTGENKKKALGEGVDVELSAEDLTTTAKVIQLLLNSVLRPEATAQNVLDEVLRRIGAAKSGQVKVDASKSASFYWDEEKQRYAASRRGTQQTRGIRVRVCYICRLAVTTPHETFPSMCQPCGAFNIAGSALSLPHMLDLDGKTALVTGARVNLGYYTALRLLRCGAGVIASTRYPRDAISRYQAEPDSAAWSGRLRIVGADFRAARDAFALIEQAQAILNEWGGRLDILINNAAQTLTDSVQKEEVAVERELLLEDEQYKNPLLIEHVYAARVRGGMNATIENSRQRYMLKAQENQVDASTPADNSTKGSSWVQSLSDIPYEDIISAHSVNTFVPLILVRELLPLMGVEVSIEANKEPLHDNTPRQAAGYIINVSSREGIFETSRSASAKNGRHVHTNMSKAALNMITETEAAAAWRTRCVAMNTVDPGYMSAAPEFEAANGGFRPIGWEDGAGRVLWPVAMGEVARSDRRANPVWGRFLKHYGAVRVEPKFGRG